MAKHGMGKFTAKLVHMNADGSDPKEEMVTAVLHLGDMKDDKHDDEHMTCGQVREMYKMNECCGMPEKMFKSDDKTRRLLSDIAGEPRIEDAIRQAMKQARANGGANGLKSKIMDVLKPYL